MSEPNKFTDIYDPQKMANNGIPDYLFVIAICYEYGWGRTKNKKVAIEYYKKAAAENHPASLFRLWKIKNAYLKQATDETEIEAKKTIIKSAELGHVPAMHYLSSLYDSGMNVRKNGRKYAYWLRKAADIGFEDAMLDYANYLSEPGKKIKKVEYYESLIRSLAEIGNVRGTALLGQFLLSKRDENCWNEGLNCLKSAADQSDSLAHRLLGWIYRHGENGVKIDGKMSDYHLDMADKLLRKSVESLIK